MSRVAAEHRLDPRGELLHLKGLDNKIVRTELETEHLVENLALCRYHNDRLRGDLANLAAYLPAVLLRHHNVEQNKIRLVHLKAADSVSAVICGLDLISVILKIQLEHVTDINVVVNYKNLCSHHHPPLINLLSFCRRPSIRYLRPVAIPENARSPD